MLPHQRLCLRRHPKAQLVLQPHGAQETQRIGLERSVRDGAHDARLDVLAAAERIDCLPAGKWLRDRVDREVACGEVVLDRRGERCEVDRPAVGERDAPRAVTHRDREGRASRALRVAARRVLRLAAGDVHVHDLPPEQPVADGAADDPGLLARQHLAG